MSKRCFVAVDLSDEIRLEIGGLVGILKKTPTQVRWVIPENLHLTLKFLGDVRDEDISPVKSLLNQLVCVAEPFEVHLSDLGAFPDRNHPAVIWAGLDEGTEPLKELASGVQRSCQGLIRFEDGDRDFSAHLTIGRLKDPRDYKNTAGLLESVTFRSAFLLRVQSVCLFESRLLADGPVYTKIHEAGFGGRLP